jgi:hypothetical protein
MRVLRRPLESALHATVAVMDEAALPDWAAVTQRLLECIEHEVRAC